MNPVRPADLLADPATSRWLIDALNTALRRDPVDAATDAALLAEALASHADDILVEMQRAILRGGGPR